MNSKLKHHGIKGQRWGVRRYQNDDGTLTDKGKKRYNQDIVDNNYKKKENRVDVSTPNPKKWVSEDISNIRDTLNTTKNVTDNLRNVNNSLPSSKKKPLDLSNMSDKELRDAINRNFLEKQYNDIYNKNENTIDKGKKYTETVLKTVGTTVSIAASVASLALAIQQLKK